MELIDRAAALAAIKSYCTNCDNYDGVRCRSCGYADALNKVEEVPTVDAVPLDYHERCLQLEVEKRFELEKHFSEAGKVVVAKKETTTEMEGKE